MTYEIFMRRAPLGPGSPWESVGGAATVPEVEDELASWSGPRPNHGDLLRVPRWPATRELYVFDSAAGSWLRAPRSVSIHAQVPWLGFWEGHMADAETMLRVCDPVDRRHVALAACDCAATATPSILEGQRDLALSALNVVRAWAAGDVATDHVADAARRANVNINTATQERHHALYSVISACQVATVDRSYAHSAAYAAREAALSAAAAAAPRGTPDASPGLRRMAKVVRERIPLSVALCAAMGLRDPAPPRGTRKNPARPARRRPASDLDVRSSRAPGPDAFDVEVAIKGQAGEKHESHVYATVGRGPRIASMLYDIGAEVVSEDLDHDDGDVYGYINHVYVAPDARRRGLGSAMVRAAIERMGRLRVKDVYLEAGPEEEGVGVPQLLEFYRRLGFRRDTSEPYGNLLRLRIGGGS